MGTNGSYLNSDSNGISSPQKIEGQDVVTWCTTSLAAQYKCTQLAEVIAKERTLFGPEYIELQCVRVRYDNT